MAAHAGTALHQAPGERSIAAAHQADCGAMGLRLARWQLRQQMAGTEIGMWIVWWIGAHKTMIQVLPCFKDLMRKKTSIQQGMFFLLLLAYYLNQWLMTRDRHVSACMALAGERVHEIFSEMLVKCFALLLAFWTQTKCSIHRLLLYVGNSFHPRTQYKEVHCLASSISSSQLEFLWQISHGQP